MILSMSQNYVMKNYVMFNHENIFKNNIFGELFYPQYDIYLKVNTYNRLCI